jgi:hypothetical protein
MAPQHHDWTVPAPLRALLWWPPVAFVLAMIDPSAAPATIAAAGAALAVFGVVGAAVGGAVARRLAARRADAAPMAPPPALPLPTADAVSAMLPGEQRAA